MAFDHGVDKDAEPIESDGDDDDGENGAGRAHDCSPPVRLRHAMSSASATTAMLTAAMIAAASMMMACELIAAARPKTSKSRFRAVFKKSKHHNLRVERSMRGEAGHGMAR